MQLKNLDTPCIGICSTVYGDTICRGCKRHYNEVIEWNTYNAGQKEKIFSRLETDIVEIVTGKLEVTDAEKLQQQMDKFQLRYRDGKNPLCLTYYLLRDAHENIQDITKYGVTITSPFDTLSLSGLYTLIENELLKQTSKLASI